MNNNLKDTKEKSLTSYGTDIKNVSFSLSYTKTNKLITALYMVTDIIDKEEPIRNKLRTLGIEIISDISTTSKSAVDTGKIDQIVSFLNIASAMNFISEMNCAILSKEFIELKVSIQEFINVKPMWLTDFFLKSDSVAEKSFSQEDSDISPQSPLKQSKGHVNVHKGHTRIGVQKGSTLMKALSDKTNLMSDKLNSETRSSVSSFTSRAQDFDMLKKQRRYNIVNIIKDSGGSATIKDIRDKMESRTSDSPACSEKTLQRELLSMVKDGVLYKTGEKRWTKYSLLAN